MKIDARHMQEKGNQVVMLLDNGESLKGNGNGEREAFVLIWSFGSKVTFVVGG